MHFRYKVKTTAAKSIVNKLNIAYELNELNWKNEMKNKSLGFFV